MKKYVLFYKLISANFIFNNEGTFQYPSEEEWARNDLYRGGLGFQQMYVMLSLIEWGCTQALQVNVSIQIQPGLVEMRCKCVITSIHSTMSLIDKPNNLQPTMPSLLPPALQLLPLFLAAYSHLLCLSLKFVLLSFNKTIVSFQEEALCALFY